MYQDNSFTNPTTHGVIFLLGLIYNRKLRHIITRASIAGINRFGNKQLFLGKADELTAGDIIWAF